VNSHYSRFMPQSRSACLMMMLVSRPLTSGIEGDWSRKGAPKDDQDEAQELSEPGEDTGPTAERMTLAASPARPFR
jgi:hypothetical protein